MHYFHPKNEIDKRFAMDELAKNYQDFHKNIHSTISRATGKKEIHIHDQVQSPNEAIYERLVAAPGKYEIIGTDQCPISFSDGHIESHLKVLKVNPNFMDEYEKIRIEEEYKKQFAPRIGWQKSFMVALNSGNLKSMSVDFPIISGCKKRRRNALVGISTMDFNARAVWHKAIYKVIYGIRAAKASTIIDTVSDKSLVSQLHEFQSKADSMTLAKISAALDMPPSLRSDEDLRFLNRVLMSRVKSFAKFSPEQRIELCRVMRLEKHMAGATILKQGHPPLNFYFMFSGQCDIVKNRSDGMAGRVRVHVINSGESFGAVALEGLVQETRTATARFGKFQFLDQYRRIASGQDSPDQLSLRISLLKNITVFLDCDPSTLEQVALKTRITYYEQDSVILKEGQISTRIFFITKGSVKISKKISVVKFNDRPKYIPHDSSSPLQKNQVVISPQIIYCSCQSGGHFPEPDDPFLYDVENDLNFKQKLINRLTFLEPRCLNIANETIECKTPVVCVHMNALDFAKLVTPHIIQKTLVESIKFRVSPEDLVKQFIIKHEWDIYKKKMIAQYKK